MDKIDYIGSFAQENVSFATNIVRTAAIGDNFYRALIFVEESRFVTDTDWEAVPNCTLNQKILAIDSTDYAEHTTGLLKSWLFDYFVNGTPNNCLLVSCGTDIDTDATDFNLAMAEAYQELKPYAYFKTVCACTGAKGDEDNLRLAQAALLKLADLCADDKQLLSAAPLYPLTVVTDTTTGALKTNLVADYPLLTSLLSAGTKGDAYLVAHADATRNGALYNVGLAMSDINSTGNSVGNGVDMVASANMTAGGLQGASLPSAFRSILKAKNIGTYKFIGDNTGSVACEGEKTLCGDTVPAQWVLCYINYMSRVRIAQLLTKMNTYYNADTYGKILDIVSTQLATFAASGRLTDVAVTAPAFTDLPASKTTFTISHAWVATYVGRAERVAITGTLYV